MRNLVVTVFLIAVLQWNNKSAGYYELVEELGCQDTEFHLTCGRLDAKIAVLEATFSRNDSAFAPVKASCGNEQEALSEKDWRIYKKSDPENFYHYNLKSNPGVFEVNFRHAINKRDYARETALRLDTQKGLLMVVRNLGGQAFVKDEYGVFGGHAIDDAADCRMVPLILGQVFSGSNKSLYFIVTRCSGVNYCSFILKEDYLPSIRWGSGSVYLRYICMDDVHIIKSCTADLDIEFEGFIQSPGYPQFYIGDRTCRWILRARPSQTVRVKFLDISLRRVAPSDPGCSDRLVVSENGFDRFTKCGDSIGNTEVQSSGSVLNVSLIATSKLLFPKRGILFHYKAVGCLTPRTPKNGNIVFKNESEVHVRCCSGYVFPDTLTYERVLRCHDENTWDTDVPDCISAAENIFDAVRFKSNNYGRVNFTGITAPAMDETNNVQDIIIPSIVMVIILVGNALILLLILHYRKQINASQCQKRSETTEENELKNISSQE